MSGMAISCYPGGRIRIPVEIEPPEGMSNVPAGYGFYAEYTGPVRDIGTGETVLTSEASLQADGKSAYLEGVVPEDAPIGVYVLTHFEQRYGEPDRLLRQVTAREDIPEVSDLIVEEGPETGSIPWAKIKRVG